MITELPDEVRLGLERARKRDLQQKNRLMVHVGDDAYRVLKLWDDGFALDAETAPHIRGLVDIFDGARHLYQCLVMCSEIEAGERQYTFKRQTSVQEVPPVDYVRDREAPVALLG